MSGRTTRTNAAIIALIAIMGLSAFTLIYIPARYHPTYAIQAERLTEKPDTYFYLENPDVYVSQAISNPQESVIINSFEDTQIDELIEEHNTSNIQVSDSYYQIGIMYGDNFPSMTEYYLYWISLAALPLSIIASIGIVLFKAANRFLRRKRQESKVGMHALVLLLALAILTATATTVAKPMVSSAAVVEDSWATMSSVPQGSLGPGVVAVNGKIYVIGGISEDTLTINQEYDPATDTWTTKTSMPSPRSSFVTAVYQNRIYAIGGGGDFGMEEVTGLNQVYDPATDSWETKTSMPTARQFLGANVVNGKIYLIGGSKPVNLNDPSYVPNVNEVYDPVTDSWASRKPPPVNASNYASAVFDGKIYVISGIGASGALTQIYDPETDSWSHGAQIPTPVWGAAAGVTTGVLAPKRIYVIGGYPAFNMVQIYDPETDTWTTGAQMPTGRYGLSVAVVVDDRLYAIGGSGYEAGRANERYTPVGYNSAAQTEEPFPTTFVVAACAASVAIIGIGLFLYFKKRDRGRTP